MPLTVHVILQKTDVRQRKAGWLKGLAGMNLRLPIWTVVPAFVLRLVLGRMTDEVLLASRKVIPMRRMEAGFTFKDPELRTALEAIIQGEDHESG